MSALVDYGSSDEDSPDTRAPIQQNQVSLESLQAVTNIQPGYQPALPNHPEQNANGFVDTNDLSSPMVGPQRPNVGTNQHDDLLQQFDNDERSERDKIRLLTQTTTPMSEMPPSPPGSPPLQATARIRKFLELKATGIHFNNDLASKSSFQNPALLQNMMERAGLDVADQYATTLPLTVWDPGCFPPEAYKEELLRSQQSLRDQDAARKKMLSAAGRRNIEFTPSVASGQSSRTSTPSSRNKDQSG